MIRFVKTPFIASLLLAATIAGNAAAAPRAPDDSRVDVSWTNPDDFSDSKTTPGSDIGRPTPDEWLGELSKHLKSRAGRALAPGQTLDVVFTNVQRAGIYEPWRGPQWDDVRIVKDMFPPRIDLTFTLHNADGSVAEEGKRQLRDPAFLQRGILNETDPLRFEKRLLDDWIRKDFSAAGRS